MTRSGNTFELSFKLIKRFLEHTSTASIEIDKLGFNDVIRVADERGLLAGTLEDWLVYRKARNMTSHAYSQEAADFVIATANRFYDEAKFLLHEFETR